MQAAAMNINELNHWEQRVERAKVQVPVWYVGDVNAAIEAREKFEAAGNASLEGVFRPAAFVAGAVSAVSAGAAAVLSGAPQANFGSVAAGTFLATIVMGVVAYRDSRKRAEEQNAALVSALDAFGKGVADMDAKVNIEPTVAQVKRGQSSPDAFEQALATAALSQGHLYKQIVDRQKARIQQKIDEAANAPVETEEMKAKRVQETLNSIRELAKDRHKREREAEQNALLKPQEQADGSGTTTARRRMGMR